MYAIGVDKSGLPVGGEEKSAAFRPQKTAAKNSCVRFRILQEWDSHIAALAVSVSKARFGGFFFLGHRISFRWLRRTGPESGWPRPSLPEDFSPGKRHATYKCFL
jgi:hypothetical protein